MVLPNNIRVDKGYVEGDEVSIYYDSLIAKVISKGKNRIEAIKKIIEALEYINIQGIQTNQDFLINILETEEFRKSNIDTNFISNYYNKGYTGKTDQVNILEIKALAALCYELKYLKEVNDDFEKITKQWVLINQNKIFKFFIKEFYKNQLLLVKENKIFSVELFKGSNFQISKIKINDSFYNVRVLKKDNLYKVFFKGYFSEIKLFRDLEYECFKKLPKNKTKSNNNYLVSPMPGKVVDVLVKKNDVVNSGDILIILDAMKMENILKAVSKVKVVEVYISKGDSVAAEQNLIKLEVVN